MFTFLQRTYGKWWDMAPSRVTDIMPQTLNENMPQDFIGNQMFILSIMFRTMKLNVLDFIFQSLNLKTLCFPVKFRSMKPIIPVL